MKTKSKIKKKRKGVRVATVKFKQGRRTMTVEHNKQGDVTGLTCEIRYKKGKITELLDHVSGDIFKMRARSASAGVPMTEVLRRSKAYPTKTLIKMK